MATSRPGPKPTGRHEWNSYENYRDLHERYLETHHIIKSHDVEIEILDYEGEAFVAVYGSIECHNGVILEVEKYAECETRGRSNPRLFVRTYSYRYNAYIPGRCTVLRYDNGHGEDEYHAHPFDEKTGEAAKVGKIITRDTMPHLSDILDELQSLSLPD